MKTEIGADILYAKTLLDSGELVAIPTETVYGLAGNALDPTAVAKIFEAKERPHFNPLIIHCATWSAAQKYVSPNVPDVVHKMASELWPGALTILLPKNQIVPDIVTAGSEKVAIRIPNHPVALALLNSLAYPLAAPSANQFGYVSPTTPQHVLDSLNGRVRYILDGGNCTVGLESTIVEFTAQSELIIHRWGGVSMEDLSKYAPVIEGSKVHVKPITSGQLLSHYAPHAALYNVDDISASIQTFVANPKKRLATISFQERYDLDDSIVQFVLSPEGSLLLAASRLFDVLRTIDSMCFDVVLSEKFPDVGVGKAINDRLYRAQSAHK